MTNDDRDLSPTSEHAVDQVVRVEEPQGVRTRQLWLTALVITLAFWVALEFLIPMAWAAVIGIAEWPLYRRSLARFPSHPMVLAVTFAAATALFVIGPLSFAAVTLAQESQAAIQWVQSVQQAGLAVPAWLPSLPLVGGKAATYWQQHIGNPQAANALLGTLSAGSILGWTRSVGGEVARESALFLITLLALVTLLARGGEIGVQAEEVASRMFGRFGGEFLERLIGAVRATVNGTVLVSVLEGGILGIAYAVAGVPQPLLFATFTIVLALVPFGAWAAFGLASLILIATSHVLAGVLLFAFGAIVMTLGDNVVQPTVIGSAVELPFLLAMIGAFGGLAQFGLVGLFIGPVIMVALLLVWRQWMRTPKPD